MNILESNTGKTSWVIAYIDKENLNSVEAQLSKFPEYKEVRAFIPTVKLLKKQFKGKFEYEYVPLLFNYGFFQLPTKQINAEYLALLKERVSAIYAWVKDPSNAIEGKQELNYENKTIKRKQSQTVGVATSDEICRLIISKNEMSIYDQTELDRIKVGDTIILRGYPFENLPARILNINHKKQEVRVHLDFEHIVKEVTLAFENVFWTIYEGSYDAFKMKEESIEEISAKNKQKANLRNGEKY